MGYSIRYTTRRLPGCTQKSIEDDVRLCQKYRNEVHQGHQKEDGGIKAALSLLIKKVTPRPTTWAQYQKKMGNNNDEMTIAEKMRRAVSWLDFLDENFNDHFKSADGVLKVWEKHEYEEIDNLWEYLEPDEDGWIDEDAIEDAKLVNEAFGFEYYPIPQKGTK